MVPASSKDPSIRRKRIAFDAGTWHALHRLSLDSMRSLQELADEAFSDLLKKHHRPVTLKDALRQSVRMQPADRSPPSTGCTPLDQTSATFTTPEDRVAGPAC